MGLDDWNADAKEKEALQEKLKSLVETHEAFLLDEQLRDAAERTGVSPARVPAWNARSDCLSMQLGSAAFASAQEPFGHPALDSGSERSDTDRDGMRAEGGAEAAARDSLFHFGDRRTSFAQLLGPASLLLSSSAAAPSSSGSPSASPQRRSPAHTSDGNAFFRVMLCLASATAEMQALTKDAYAVYMPPLVLFGDENGRQGGRGEGEGGGRAGVASANGSARMGKGAAASAGASADRDVEGQTDAAEMGEEEALVGVAQLMKGHMQQLWTWQRRALDVVVYTLRQLAALFREARDDNAKSLYAPLTEVRYTAVWQSLTDLLGAVTAVEEVLHQHTSFKLGYVRLRKLVAQLCAVAAANGVDGERDEGSSSGGSHLVDLPEMIDAASLRTLQRVVVRVGDDLLPYGKALRVVAERTATSRAQRQRQSHGGQRGREGREAEDAGPPYAPLEDRRAQTHPASLKKAAAAAPCPVDPSANVRFSAAFRREMLEVLDYMLHNTEDAVGSPRESSHHLRVVGIASLYSVCLSLFKKSSSSGGGGGNGGGGGAISDGNAKGEGGNLQKAEMDACLALGRRLFHLHRCIPLVHLQGHFVFTPAIWMARRMPAEVHAFLYSKPAPQPLTTAAHSVAMAAATQELTGSLRLVQRHKASQFLAVVSRLTTLLSAWLADMQAMPLPGVSTQGVGPAPLPASSSSSSIPTPSPSPASSRAFVEHAVLLIQRGLLLARDLQFAMQQMLVHLYCTRTDVPLAFVDSITHGVEMLMMVKEAFHARSGVLASTFDVLTRSMAFIVEKHLHTAHLTLFAKVAKADAQRGGGGSSSSNGGGGGGGFFSSSSSSLSATARTERSQLRAIEQAVLLLQRPLTPDALLLLSLLLDVVANRRSLPVDGSAAPSAKKRGHDGGAAASAAAELSSGALITTESRDGIFMAFAQLTRVTEYQVALHEATSCAFLYWHRDDMYRRMFARLYERPVNASRLPYLAAALEHAALPLVMSAKHTPLPQKTLLAPYVALVQDCLEEELLRPLCTDVEDDLRMYTHGAVLGQPFRSLLPRHTPDASPVLVVAKDLTHLTRLKPFKLMGAWCDIAARVEDHLDAQFYNLNALMPNDWKTYEEMRNLALAKYGLSVAVGESCLPGGIVDQGLDVLVITQDIQLFIAYYTYNLNEQLFVQRPTSTAAKHLHTLHMRHIANSIRTHGTGIMNTTVNYVYKCLLKKLSTLSRFLADDHVRSRLARDERWIQAQRKQLRGRGSTSRFTYPLSLAVHFNEEMRKLGLADDGQTFLAKFARLVSEIGNALGYMRLIRSGGLRATADSAQFLPHDGHAGGRDRSSGRSGAGSDSAPVFSGGGVARSMFLPDYLDDVLASTSGSDSEGASGLEEEDSGDSRSSRASSRASARRRRRREAAERQRRRHLATMDAVSNVDRVAHSIQEKLSDGSEYFAMLLGAIGTQLGLSTAPTTHRTRVGTRSRKSTHTGSSSSSGSADERDDENEDGEASERQQRPTAEEEEEDSATAAERCTHLRLFYLTVPPMCVTFVEGMIREKEQLMKKSSDALFTDDGFALGCVFLLTLFGINDSFQSLHFFEGTRATYVEKLTHLHQAMMERQGLAERVAAAVTATRPGHKGATVYRDNEAEEVNNMHLTASMLDITLREYAQLEEAFVASTVFFRGDRLSTAGPQPRRGGDRRGRSDGEENSSGGEASSASRSAASDDDATDDEERDEGGDQD